MKCSIVGPHNIHDKTKKYLTAKSCQDIIDILGIHYTFKTLLPNKIVNEGFRTLIADIVILTKEGVVVI